jgi:hypothetical protein
MEHLHSHNTINIDNVNDENDELSVTPVDNEDTSISSKFQVI